MNPTMQQRVFLLIVSAVLLADCSQPKPPPPPVPPLSSVVATPSATPLDSTIYFSVQELNGHITLKLRTEKIYSHYNNEIHTVLDTTTPRGITITIHGIDECHPGVCLPAEGPATSEIDLGRMSGDYDMTFQYAHQTQVYRLMVSATAIVFVPTNHSSFVEPTHVQWKRLPENAMWFVLHNVGVSTAGGDVQPLERAVYEQLSTAFFRDIEQFDVEQFHPAEGHYTNYLFVSPWESWHETVGDRVKIPLEEEGAWLEFRSPHIRYYTYTGDWHTIQVLAETYSKQGFGVAFYNVAGYPYVP
jgi:hypothetical protein